MPDQREKSRSAPTNPKTKNQAHGKCGADSQSADGYRPKYAERARGMCTMGAKDLELADEFGVGLTQIRCWQVAHPEFGEACRIGREKAADRTEEALVHRAIGGERVVVKPMKINGRIELVRYREHVPGDVRAQIFLLTNYRPDKFKKNDPGESVDDNRVREELREQIREEMRQEQMERLLRVTQNTGKRPKEY